MKEYIPPVVLDVYRAFQKAGYHVYFVGGCVRNLLMGKEPKDWDFATNAIPEEILKLFPNGFYDNAFGTVGIPTAIDNQEKVIEVTTFRTEHGFSDKRRPDRVEWGKTIEEDLGRRDLTINAIALRFAQGKPFDAQGKKSDIEIIDPYEGQKDIQKKIIRAVGDPTQRFQEDALRLMRAIRLAATYSFIIEDSTWQALITHAGLIKNISSERVMTELLRILESDYPYEGVMLLKNARLLEHILPELLEGAGVSQVRPGRHHTSDVFTHNLLSLKFCPAEDPIVRLATLLHDIAKPRVAATDTKGLVIFHNHEIVGAKMAREICDRLKFSKKDRDKIVNLIRWHMFTVDEKITDAAVRRFIRRIGVENVQDMMDLRIGDRLGGGTQTAESWRLKLFRKRIEDQLKPAPFSINDLAIDGNDIMKELNIKPGPKVGEILQRLFEEVDEDLSKNTQEYLITRLKQFV